MLTITGLQLNLENGGIDVDEDGEPVSRARFEAFLQLIDTLKREHGLAFVLQQEARYYDRDGHALLNEAAERTFARKFADSERPRGRNSHQCRASVPGHRFGSRGIRARSHSRGAGPRAGVWRIRLRRLPSSTCGECCLPFSASSSVVSNGRGQR